MRSSDPSRPNTGRPVCHTMSLIYYYLCCENYCDWIFILKCHRLCLVIFIAMASVIFQLDFLTVLLLILTVVFITSSNSKAVIYLAYCDNLKAYYTQPKWTFSHILSDIISLLYAFHKQSMNKFTKLFSIWLKLFLFHSWWTSFRILLVAGYRQSAERVLLQSNKRNTKSIKQTKGKTYI